MEPNDVLEAQHSTSTDTEIETADVEAVNAKAQRPLYESRVKIHPKRARGTFRKIKWIIMAVTLGIYYGVPWIRWDRGPYLPDQAVLVDIPERRFFFFFIEIWPQEFYFAAGLLILAALVLFLVTSVAGRVWCGYSCPQTVWTDLMIAVERWVEGDRASRLRLDKAPMTGSKLRKRVLKHAIWLLIALFTGGAWVFYFGDAPTLLVDLVTGNGPYVAYTTIAILTASTYLLGGLAREQVCTYMCPWPRIQGAMLDDQSLMVSYREWRGEPRGHRRKDQSWDERGDCIDCKQCVVVCPMGIDIREGPQLECINCALCIDACNEIMTKIDRPPNLIAYDSFQGLEAAAKGESSKVSLIRPRTIIYASLIAVVGLIMLAALVMQTQLELSVLRDRNPLFVKLADGSIRNGYSLRLLNKSYGPIDIDLSINGLPGATISVLGHDGTTVNVLPDDVSSIRVFVTLPADQAAKTGDSVRNVDFIARQKDSDLTTRHASTFRLPEKR